VVFSNPFIDAYTSARRSLISWQSLTIRIYQRRLVRKCIPYIHPFRRI